MVSETLSYVRGDGWLFVLFGRYSTLNVLDVKDIKYRLTGSIPNNPERSEGVSHKINCRPETRVR